MGGGGNVFDPIISESSGIKLSVKKGEGLVMYTFDFPEVFGECKVHLVQADVDGGVAEIEADTIFGDFQRCAWPKEGTEEKEGGRDRKRSKIENQGRDKSASYDSDTPLSKLKQDPSSASTSLIPFRRHPLKSHAGGPGRMLTQQFTCNYGVPYKHVVAMGTQPLSPTLSPPVILSTLSLLTSRTLSVLSPSSSNLSLNTPLFNELYPVLYLAHQKMAFHDDGEPGLGPIVSSLSLGSTCRMKFRLKPKHSATFPQVKLRDRVVLDLPLRHGSVVVQEGGDLQRFFEHCVNPNGFRVAVTVRNIDPGENDKGERGKRGVRGEKVEREKKKGLGRAKVIRAVRSDVAEGSSTISSGGGADNDAEQNIVAEGQAVKKLDSKEKGVRAKKKKGLGKAIAPKPSRSIAVEKLIAKSRSEIKRDEQNGEGERGGDGEALKQVPGQAEGSSQTTSNGENVGRESNTSPERDISNGESVSREVNDNKMHVDRPLELSAADPSPVPNTGPLQTTIIKQGKLKLKIKRRRSSTGASEGNDSDKIANSSVNAIDTGEGRATSIAG